MQEAVDVRAGQGGQAVEAQEGGFESEVSLSSLLNFITLHNNYSRSIYV